MRAWERLERISKDPTLTALFTILRVDPVIGLHGGDSPKYDVVKLGRKHPESVIAGAVAEAVSCVLGASKSGPWGKSGTGFVEQNVQDISTSSNAQKAVGINTAAMKAGRPSSMWPGEDEGAWVNAVGSQWWDGATHDWGLRGFWRFPGF
jgi:hypothetical protein